MPDRPIAFAVHKKPPALCECGHELHEHNEDGRVYGKCSVPGCDCIQYRRKGALRKGTKRNIRSYAIKAQRLWARIAGFINREGHGADSLFYGPDGEPLLLAEHKHRPAPSYWEKDMNQARSYARGAKGRPFPVCGYTSKPGTGTPSRRYMVIDAEDWPKIAERLGGQG
jgi:hypothetical protein